MNFYGELVERFLRYVSVDTQSAENIGHTPSTSGQYELACILKGEMEKMGLTEISIDSKGYLFATLPANTDKQLPVIGFIAHLDTSPDMSGKGVKPRIVKNYDGYDIPLDEKGERILSPLRFPELSLHKGEDLVVTDGETLLGADDKAGIAEILTAVSYLLQHPEIRHGKIRIGFNPDEEIGMGARFFDVSLFGCDWAYTMDGGEAGELEYENFNAASATITINGQNVHPGYAKGKMVNALRIAAEFIENELPMEEAPEETEGYQGFYHPTEISGGVDKTLLRLIIRDHDRTCFEERKRRLTAAAAKFNRKCGTDRVMVEIKDTYYNMREKIEPVKQIIALAERAMRAAGVPPRVVPIRGGTDGAQLSFKGLPCPNIFAGGINFHSRYEFVSVQTMQKAVMTIVKIAELAAKE